MKHNMLTVGTVKQIFNPEFGYRLNDMQIINHYPVLRDFAVAIMILHITIQSLFPSEPLRTDSQGSDGEEHQTLLERSRKGGQHPGRPPLPCYLVLD